MKRYVACGVVSALLGFWACGCAPNKTATAQRVAVDWLKLVDSSNYEQSWDEAASELKNHVAKKQWQQLLERNREPLGRLLSRRLRSAEYMTKLPGAPDGEYVVIEYESSFEHRSSAIETVIPMMDKDGQYRVSSFFIK